MGWGAGTRAPSWRCARPGARPLATCMDDLDGTGQGRPRAHAAPPRGSGVDRLSERSTDCSARDNALPGTAMQEQGIHMVAARPGVFVHSSHVMNTTAPAAIPGRRPFSTGAPGAHIAHGTLNTPTRRPYRRRARNRAQRSQFGCSRPCPPVAVLCPVCGACVESPGPAVCARVATAWARPWARCSCAYRARARRHCGWPSRRITCRGARLYQR